MTRDEKDILVSFLTRQWLFGFERDGYDRALSRLVAKGYVVNRRYGTGRHRHNSYELTEIGRAVAVQAALKRQPRRATFPRKRVTWHRQKRLFKRDLYGCVVPITSEDEK